MVPWLQYPPLSHLSWVIQKSGPLPLLSQLPIIQPSYLVLFYSHVKIIMMQPISTMNTCVSIRKYWNIRNYGFKNYLDWNKREIHPRAFVVPWHHRRASENQCHSFRPNYVVEPPKFPVHNNNNINNTKIMSTLLTWWKEIGFSPQYSGHAPLRRINQKLKLDESKIELTKVYRSLRDLVSC